MQEEEDNVNSVSKISEKEDTVSDSKSDKKVDSESELSLLSISLII